VRRLERRVSAHKKASKCFKSLKNRHANDAEQHELSKKRDQFLVELDETLLLRRVVPLSVLTQMSMTYWLV